MVEIIFDPHNPDKNERLVLQHYNVFTKEISDKIWDEHSRPPHPSLKELALKYNIDPKLLKRGRF